MAPSDTQTPNPPGAVVQIKLEVKHPGGEIENGKPAGFWQFQARLEPQNLTSCTDTLFLYANDLWRVGRDESHK